MKHRIATARGYRIPPLVMRARWFAALLALVGLAAGVSGDGFQTIAVDAQVHVSFTGLTLNRSTNTFDTVATVSNVGTASIAAPITLVVTAIAPATVQLANANGTAASGHPYVTVLASGRLDVGASVSPVLLKFSNPGRVAFTFSQSVLGVIAPADHVPRSDAGPDQTVKVATTVRLEGSRSTDVDGNALTYRWSLVQRPTGSNAVLANAASVMPTFVADRAGTYTAQLIVNDGALDSAPASVVIGTVNSRPVANAGADQTIALGASVGLDASHSTDVDGDLLTYRWSVLASPTGSAAAPSDANSIDPTFVPDKAGAYTLQLIVNDGHFDSAPSRVTLSTQNSLPVADPGPDQRAVIGSNVELDGSRSSDADSEALSYRWALIALPTGSSASLVNPTSANPRFTVDRAGIYVAQLIVNDGNGDSVAKTVVVSTSNTRPVADAGPDQTAVAGQSVALDGTGSHDADNDALTFAWSLLSRPRTSTVAPGNATHAIATLVPDVVGSYVAQLIVNDGKLRSYPATSTVIVTVPAPNHDPQITSTPVTTGRVGANYSYQVQASDVDGDALSYALNVAPVSMNIGDSGLITWTPNSKGTFDVTVQVSDGHGGKATQSFKIVVAAAQAKVPDVVGRTQAQATSDIVAAGLGVGTISQQASSTVLAGNVIRETPPAGTFVDQGTTVDLVISTGSGLPPDPATVAPRLDPTVATSLFSATSFLYTGPNPIQTGVAPGTIDSKRGGVLRGKVADISGEALTGVKVTVVSHPEFGQTLSRADGMFDMAANAGGFLTVRYEKAGYLPAQRQVKTAWQEFTLLPDVVLLQRDSQATTVHLGAGTSSMQVARGSTQTDSDGSRRATALFPAGITAALVQPDGSLQPTNTLNVRFTEYTVGANGQKAMPAQLPPTTAYTYAVELGSDESVAKVDGRDVVFNQPVVVYVENFMKVPVGQNVPVGYYDPARSAWAGAANGRVVKILSITAGKADLDTDGNGSADGAAALAALGISDAERQQLAALYGVGTSLWRVPVDHFSTFDFNWSFICVPLDCGPPTETPPPQPPPTQCAQAGSIIGCERQTLGEEIAVVGTPFSLHYQSDRVPGRTAEQGALLTLASKGLPTGVKAIQVEILVAGQKLTQSIPTGAGTTTYAWDGNDAYGRPLIGSFPVTTRIGYTYDIIPSPGVTVPSSWARFAGVPLSVNGWRTQLTLYQEHTTQITRQDQRGAGLGGWSLDVLHHYDPAGRVLTLGDGTQREVDTLSAAVMTTVAGNGGSSINGEGIPATQSSLPSPQGLAFAADGTLYVADNQLHRVLRITPDGLIGTVAGTGSRGFSGDGGPAINAQLALPSSVAVAPDGTLYIADKSNFRVRRVAPNGIISTLIGTGIRGSPIDGTVAITNTIVPDHVVIGADGNLYISDDHGIWVLDQSGIIRSYAGGGAANPDAGGPALQVSLVTPQGMTFAPDGSLFFVESNHIRKVTPQGILSTVAGNGSDAFSGDGGPALSAALGGPFDVAIDRDGALYVGVFVNRVRRIGPDGVISAFAGTGSPAFNGDNAPGAQTNFGQAAAVAVGPDGALYVSSSHRIRKIAAALPGFSSSDMLVPSEDGAEVYVFNGSGRHLRTVNAVTGATLLQFTYDAAGNPITITDGDGNATTIERSGARPTAIVAAGGQRTVLATNADGWLTQVTNPANESLHMEYSVSGLLASFADARGNTSHFHYDTLGRLVSDQNPMGGTLTLTRAEKANGFTVTATSSLGTTASYSVEQQVNGDLLRTTTAPGGAITTTLSGANGTDQITDPTGRILSATYGPDPRWGMLAPIPAAITVSTPSGHQAKATVSAAVNLTNPNDLFSISTQSRTTTINGKSFTNTYNAASRKFTLQSPMGRQRTMTVDVQGRATQQAIGGLFAQNWAYDARGRLQSVTSGTGTSTRTLTLAYSADNTVHSWTDPIAQTETFSHDAAGRLTARAFTDGRTFQYSYDLDGNVAGIVPPGRPQHTFAFTPDGLTALYTAPDVGGGATGTVYTYNAEGRLTSATLPNADHLQIQRDSAGRMTALTTLAGTTTYGYDAGTGLPSTTHSADGVVLSDTYDGDLWNGTTWSGALSGKVGRQYDNDFRVTASSVNNVPIAFAYDNDGLVTLAGALALTRNAQHGLVTATTLGSATDATTYTGFGETSTYNAVAAGVSIFQASFSYDALGRIQSRTEKIDGVTTTYAYAYDPAGRLAQVTTNGAVSASYTYDGNGNRLSAPGLAAPPTYDAQDRLLRYGATTYAYNANGDLVTKSNGAVITRYTYDALDNLKHVQLANGTMIDYAVDGRNRRALKKVNGNVVRGYLYEDDFSPIAELDASGNVVSRFVYATRKSIPDYVIKQGVAYRIFADPLGSPRVVVDSTTGHIVQRMDYDEFGNVVADSNPGFQPFGFAGGLYDKDTGLVRFGLRDYQADVGRWTTKDPVRFEGGDTNLYAYVLNDPVNNADQLGLQRRNLLNLAPDLEQQLQELQPDPGSLDVAVHSDGKSFLKDGEKVTDVGKLVALVLESEQWKKYAKANPTQRVIRLVACKSGGSNATLAKDFYDGMNKWLKDRKQTPTSVKAPKDSFDYTDQGWNVRGYKNGKGWQMIP